MPTDGTYDTGYRLLFSQPRMVRDLCRGFLREEWTGWLDLASLAAVDDDPSRPLLGRMGETAVWRLRWQGGADGVLLLLRSQAEEDPWMALQVAFCRQLLYQRLLRRGGARGPSRLPVALPVVLYHGATRWKAAAEAVELFLPLPAALQRHVPRTRYLLLDVGHDPIPEGAGEDNLVSLLCQLERSRTATAVDYLLERLIALVGGEENEELRQAWSSFLGRSFLPRRFPDLFDAAAALSVAECVLA